MRFSFATLTFLLLIVGVNSFAANTNPTKESKKEISKTAYDFNVFKIFTLNEVKLPVDSLQISASLKLIKSKED